MPVRFSTAYRRGRNFLNLTQQEEVMATQMKNKPVLRPLALAIFAALSSQAFAQTASTDDGALNLDKVIVTGQPEGVSKMKSSNSVSTLSADQITQTGATSTAELLRSIPGIRSESSGGESNANVTVRGLPISAGGSRYVQFQENGLPIMLFGDVAFATPDTFFKADNGVDRLEVVRGGASSTLATNAPGGIINFISKTGEEKGGSIGLTQGLGYDSTRYDVDFGGRISDKTRFSLAGYYRNGEGARHTGVNTEQGGQIGGNITQELSNGFVRLNFKHLDDHAPTLLPVPVKVTGSTISELPGIDPRKASFYSPYLLRDIVLDRNNNKVSTNINEGLSAKTDSLGMEAQFKLGEGWTLDEKFRTARNSGRFIGIFPGDNVANVSTTYATGPNSLVGNPALPGTYNGPAFTAVIFNTSIDDLGSTVNDVKLTKSFAISSDSKFNTTGGLFTSLQNVALTWNFNQYLMQAVGEKPALLTSAINGTPGFGGCCSNTIDAQYKTTSPYLALGFETGGLNLDGSVRYDKQFATGTYNQSVSDGAGGRKYDPANTRIIDYDVKKTSYSLGANYRFTKDLALFGRYSDGAEFNADRIAFFNDPRLVNGSSPIPINKVKQIEAGTKWRMGNLSTFLTFFKAKTDESNFDVTTQKASANSYDAKGLELEAAYRFGGFRLAGGGTYTDAKVTASNSPSSVGTTPKRQAKFVYQVTPSFNFAGFNIGANIIGTTKAMDDGAAGALKVELPAYTVVNAFASYEVASSATLSLGVNNLTNTIGYTESNDGRDAARSINGRTVKAALKYSF
jgi:outer membrane receptor protein involved in Fe transport